MIVFVVIYLLVLFYIFQVSGNCAQHVRRAMHQRALDVHLIPEVQEACMKDLGSHCSHSIEKGQVCYATVFDLSIYCISLVM